MRYHCTPVKMTIIRQSANNECWKAVEKREPFYTVGRNVNWYSYCVYKYVYVCSVAESCPTVCHPTDCSLPGSSVHGIFQARILVWVAISHSKRSSWARDWKCNFCVSCTGKQRRQWHPTPVLLPGKSHGWRSLVGCSPWGCWVGHDWATSLSLFTSMHWRRKW